MLSLIPMIVMSTSAQTPPALLANVHKIVCMGDSITAAGVEPNGFVTVMDKTLREVYPGHKIEFVGVGIGGQKAPDMHARFKRDVIAKHPDLVTISVGVNDVWHDFRDPAWTKRVPTGDSGRGVKLDVHLAELEAMVSEAEAAHIKVVMLSPTVIYEDLGCDENKRLDKYISAQRSLAKRHNAIYVDLNRAFKTAISGYQKVAGKTHLLLTTDGVHMNDQGNALMAAQILSSMGVPLPDRIKPQ